MQEGAVSYVVVDDAIDPSKRGAERHVLNIRAVISTRSELQELIEKLTRRLETDFTQEDSHDQHRLESLHSGEPANHRDAGR
jgi:hypothetical protein